jgi:hypothetical protein
MRVLGTLTAAAVAVFAAGIASAAEVTYISVSGIWHDAMDNVPGSQPGEPVITNGVPTSSINWGTTTGSQSGYDFTTTLPPPFTLPGPIPFFSLGNFTHRNFEVNDPSLTSVQLDVILELEVDGVPTGPLTFTFTFNHEETPNNPTPPDTCPYPTPLGEGCTDRVTIVGSAEPTTFNVDGVDYTLQMSFLDNGNPVSEFITREGGTVNSSGLVGEFTLPPGLTVSKTGPASLRLAEWGDFVISSLNESEADAYNVTLIDRLPDSPTGGMCGTTPEVLNARVFASDGVTPIPGKGPLNEGTDYSLVYDGALCELTFRTLSAASVISIGERLVINYRAQLDVDTEDGITLMQQGEQHVRCPLRVIREHDMPVPLELPIQAAQQNHRHFDVRVPVRVAHVAAFVNQDVIQQRAVAVRDLAQLLSEVRQILNVIPVHLGVAGHIIRLVTMVRGTVPGAIETRFREARAR